MYLFCLPPFPLLVIVAMLAENGTRNRILILMYSTTINQYAPSRANTDLHAFYTTWMMISSVVVCRGLIR